jgi:hypothetical protein
MRGHPDVRSDARVDSRAVAATAGDRTKWDGVRTIIKR